MKNIKQTIKRHASYVLLLSGLIVAHHIHAARQDLDLEMQKPVKQAQKRAQGRIIRPNEQEELKNQTPFRMVIIQALENLDNPKKIDSILAAIRKINRSIRDNARSFYANDLLINATLRTDLILDTLEAIVANKRIQNKQELTRLRDQVLELIPALNKDATAIEKERFLLPGDANARLIFIEMHPLLYATIAKLTERERPRQGRAEFMPADYAANGSAGCTSCPDNNSNKEVAREEQPTAYYYNNGNEAKSNRRIIRDNYQPTRGGYRQRN